MKTGKREQGLIFNIKTKILRIKDKEMKLLMQNSKQNQKFTKKRMKLAGVVPGSDMYLGHDDADGNQLFRVTCLTDMA